MAVWGGGDRAWMCGLDCLHIYVRLLAEQYTAGGGKKVGKAVGQDWLSSTARFPAQVLQCLT